jgi:hypothetical protein
MNLLGDIIAHFWSVLRGVRSLIKKGYKEMNRVRVSCVKVIELLTNQIWGAAGRGIPESESTQPLSYFIMDESVFPSAFYTADKGKK